MFNCIWKHITTHLLTDRDAEHELSEKESLSVPHESFLLSRSSVYIGGEDYFCRLNQYVVDTKGTPMVVLGDPGCGKSALLSTWIAGKRKHYPTLKIIYHFVGCAKNTADLPNILKRLILELNHFLGVPEPKDTVEEGIDTSPIVLADKKDTKSANDLARDFLELLKKITATK